METVKHQLQQLIAQGQTDTAIEVLLRVTSEMEKEELHSEVILHSNRYNAYLKDKRLGVYTPQEVQRELTLINQSLLFIINQLPEGLEAPFPLKEAASSAPPGQDRPPRRRGMALGVIAFVSLIALAVWVGTSNDFWGAKARSSDAEAAAETDTVEEKTPDEELPPATIAHQNNVESRKEQPPPASPGPEMEKTENKQAENPMERLRGESVVVKGGAGAVGVVSTFSMNKNEVTIGQYLLFCQKTGHPFPLEIRDTTQKRRPITYVSWFDAVEYCKYVGGRLPTVAEWEYAATGGEKSRNYEYSGGNDLKQVGWSAADGVSSPQPVGGRNANELGLYDMSGNVREWCQDTAAENEKYRMVKGGAWKSYAPILNPIKTPKPEPAGARDNMTGFRVVFD